MTTTEFPRQAGAVTRQIKQLVRDPEVHVTTRWCINTERDGYGWHSIIMLERGEARNILAQQLEARGWRVTNQHEYDTFFGAYLPEPEKKGDAQRGEAFLKSTFGTTTRTEF